MTSVSRRTFLGTAAEVGSCMEGRLTCVKNGNFTAGIVCLAGGHHTGTAAAQDDDVNCVIPFGRKIVSLEQPLLLPLALSPLLQWLLPLPETIFLPNGMTQLTSSSWAAAVPV